MICCKKDLLFRLEQVDFFLIDIWNPKYHLNLPISEHPGFKRKINRDLFIRYPENYISFEDLKLMLYYM